MNLIVNVLCKSSTMGMFCCLYLDLYGQIDIYVILKSQNNFSCYKKA